MLGKNEVSVVSSLMTGIRNYDYEDYMVIH